MRRCRGYLPRPGQQLALPWTTPGAPPPHRHGWPQAIAWRLGRDGSTAPRRRARSYRRVAVKRSHPALAIWSRGRRMPLEPIWVVFVTVVLIGCLILGRFGAGTGAAESGPPTWSWTPPISQPGPRSAGTRPAAAGLVRAAGARSGRPSRDARPPRAPPVPRADDPMAAALDRAGPLQPRLLRIMVGRSWGGPDGWSGSGRTSEP